MPQTLCSIVGQGWATGVRLSWAIRPLLVAVTVGGSSPYGASLSCTAPVEICSAVEPIDYQWRSDESLPIAS